MGRLKRPVYVADFETKVNVEKTSVWLWGLINQDEVFEYGDSIESFINRIKKRDSKVYFHNLKFDLQFILYYLMKELGYKYTSSKKLNKCEISTLISDMGVFYSSKICFDTGATVEFVDSLKVLPMAVRDIPKAFGLDIEKLDIEYDKSDTNYEITDKDIQYVKHDVLVVKRGIDELHKQNLKKLTTASNALENYKAIEFSDRKIKTLFPPLPLEIDIDCRKSYKGGWTYLNKRFAEKDIGLGQVYDVNSMYPWAMSTQPLPYGEPIFYKGEYEPDNLYPLYIESISLKFKLKPNKFPCIQVKGSFRFLETEYLEQCDDGVTIVVTSVDWELIKECYDVYDVEYIAGYKFKASTKLFKRYIDYWYDVKRKATEEGNKALRSIAKLMLNSLYGKFGSNPIKRSKYPEYDEETDTIRYNLGPEEKTEGLYVPVASFITAHARNKIIRAANSCYKSFLYADTDSLHIMGDDIPDIEIHDTKLGAFKCKSKFTRAKYLRAKCYIEEIDGELDKKCAGLPVRARGALNFSTLKHDMVFDGKLMFKVIPGGATLKETTFKLK